jgi:hypothetical protein
MVLNTMSNDAKSLIGYQRVALQELGNDMSNYYLLCFAFVSRVRGHLIYDIGDYSGKEKDIDCLNDVYRELDKIFRIHKRGPAGGEIWKSLLSDIQIMFLEVDDIIIKNKMAAYVAKREGVISQ